VQRANYRPPAMRGQSTSSWQIKLYRQIDLLGPDILHFVTP